MDIKNTEPTFSKIEWLNKIDERKSYLTTKVVQVLVTSTGDFVVDCWFAPKSVTANWTQWNIAFQTFSDFSLSYWIYWYTLVGVFTSVQTSNMVETTTTTANPWNRLSNWFILTVSSFAWSSFYVNFLCQS